MERFSIDEIGVLGKDRIPRGSNRFSKGPAEVEKCRTRPGKSQPTKPTSCPTVQVEAAEDPERAGAAMVGPDGG